MRKTLSIILIGALTIVLTGCLTTDTKEYTWEFNNDGSGQGKIVFENIFSSGNTDEDYSLEDFNSLINDYIEGTTLEDTDGGMRDVEKRLYIDDGKLCGEITFKFDNYQDVGFYRYENDGPYMYLVNLGEEFFVNCNGEWAGEDFPVIFWPEATKEFILTTSLG
ncbi:hypothetical protein KAH81_10375, partial [bacterium]|nr:hypothetical protein [bacterium]